MAMNLPYGKLLVKRFCQVAMEKFEGGCENCQMATGKKTDEPSPKPRTTMRLARKALKISQETLADHLRISVSQISNFESGKRHPRIHEAQKIAELLKIKLEDILTEDERAATERRKDEIVVTPHVTKPPTARPFSGFGEGDEATAYIVDEVKPSQVDLAVTKILRDRPNAHAVVMTTDILALRGIHPGDVLVFDLGDPKPGDIVRAQIVDLELDATRTVFRIYKPPYLLCAPRNPAPAPLERIDDENVIIRAVMTDHLARSR
jgi:transcriptional regulator with XRE-family HTH domain